MKTVKKKIKLESTKNKTWGSAFENVPGWDLNKIKAAKVMVVGAGALGNEVIKNLTLLDVGHLLIVDFDNVEYTNLAKSILFRKEDTGTKKALAIAKNLKQINNSVKTLSIVGDIANDIGLGVFRRMDVVIGCLDNRLARMFINRHCFKVNKSWVDGGIENLSGGFSVYASGKACYECSLSDDAWEVIRFRMGCPDIAKRNASLGVITTTPISSSIIGSFQVQEALKIIFGDEKNSIVGEKFRYDGSTNFFLKYKGSELKEDCDSHVSFDPIIEAPKLSHNNTIKEVFDWLEKQFETKQLKILLEDDIVLEVVTSNRGKKCFPAVYKSKLAEASEVIALERQPDEELYIKESTTFINRDFSFPNKTLKQIGVPFLDILKIETHDDIHYVELTGDVDLLRFE